MDLCIFAAMAGQGSSGDTGNRTQVASRPCRPISPPWRAGAAWTPWAISSKWSGSKPRTSPATAKTVPANLGNFDAETFEKRRGRIAVRHHSHLLLLGADIVAQIEIDVAFEVDHFVAERG